MAHRNHTNKLHYVLNKNYFRSRDVYSLLFYCHDMPHWAHMPRYVSLYLTNKILLERKCGMPLVDSKARDCTSQLTQAILRQLRKNTQHLPILIVGIGTDKVIGDSFGPLVGEFLCRRKIPNTKVIGTLKNPIHALNLHTIHTTGYFTIALDSSMGESDCLYHFSVKPTPIYPGCAVGKQLNPIGDMSIGAILVEPQYTTTSNYAALRGVRLYHVMGMAKTTANALVASIQRYEQERNN